MDTTHPKVVVYIISDRVNPHSGEIQKVAKLFDDDLFAISITTIDQASAPKDKIEQELIGTCLRNQSKVHPHDYMIIIKDSSTSLASPEEIAKFVSSAISAKDWDICYLNRWADRCDLNINPRDTGINSLMAETYAPQGAQAILISPPARDVMTGKKPLKNGQNFTLTGNFAQTLNYYVSHGLLRALCAKPNLIIFDPNLVKTPEDLIKTSECLQPEVKNNLLTSTNGETNWLMVILIMLVVLVIILALARNRN